MPSPLLSEPLKQECASITPTDKALEDTAQTRLDNLTKPRGSLGRLEDIARKLFAIQGQAPITARPARMLTIAADHGVVEEGVASNPQAVTVLMVNNFLAGGAAINALCGAAGAELLVVDAGVAAAPFPEHERLVRARVAQGTANMAVGPAMSVEECVSALELGVSLAENARRDGIHVLGTGEMGIGNTTASSALFCAYFGFSPGDMTGMGAGVPQGGLPHKARVIEQALAVNADAVTSGDPVAILAAVGGLEIAALAGLILGGAARKMAVVIDGFISTAAYAAAWKIRPSVHDYCFFSHGSAEAGHAAALRRLGEPPLLDLGLRLGEGTGAALGFMLLDAAARAYNEMATFGDAGIAMG